MHIRPCSTAVQRPFSPTACHNLQRQASLPTLSPNTALPAFAAARRGRRTASQRTRASLRPEPETGTHAEPAILEYTVPPATARTLARQYIGELRDWFRTKVGIVDFSVGFATVGIDDSQDNNKVGGRYRAAQDIPIRCS